MISLNKPLKLKKDSLFEIAERLKNDNIVVAVALTVKCKKELDEYIKKDKVGLVINKRKYINSFGSIRVYSNKEIDGMIKKVYGIDGFYMTKELEEVFLITLEINKKNKEKKSK